MWSGVSARMHRKIKWLCIKSQLLPVTRTRAPVLPLRSVQRHRGTVMFLTHEVIFTLLSPFLIFYLFLERGREGERETETSDPRTLPTRDLAHNPGMCPDWESNLWPFCLQAGTQSTEPHKPGLVLHFYQWMFALSFLAMIEIKWCSLTASRSHSISN